jgi:hypothetical protein
MASLRTAIGFVCVLIEAALIPVLVIAAYMARDYGLSQRQDPVEVSGLETAGFVALGSLLMLLAISVLAFIAVPTLQERRAYRYLLWMWIGLHLFPFLGLLVMSIALPSLWCAIYAGIIFAAGVVICSALPTRKPL